MHVTYSETFKGVGLHDGGPYAIYDFDPNMCTETPEEVPNCFDPPALANQSLDVAKSGVYMIDPLDNIKDQPVYISGFGAESFIVVNEEQQEAVKLFYDALGAKTEITYEKSYPHIV